MPDAECCGGEGQDAVGALNRDSQGRIGMGRSDEASKSMDINSETEGKKELAKCWRERSAEKGKSFG